MTTKPKPIDILQMELDQDAPYWLAPGKVSNSKLDAIREKNRKAWLAKKKAEKNADKTR